MLVSLPSGAVDWVCTDNDTFARAVVVHVITRGPSPIAVHVSSALLPFATVKLCGGVVITGGSTEQEMQIIQVNTATLVLTLPVLFTAIKKLDGERSAMV